ncbi:MAG: hypothetical protein GY792_31235 [Gammaproteobacteria bacterium]|nr:hypothetical protein [Gammaproteobacteria bacterium]
MANRLQQAIVAIKSGNTEHAQRLLNQLLQSEPRNVLAWVWLAKTVRTLEWRRACLDRALAIDPDNEQARQALLEWVMTDDGDSERTTSPTVAPLLPQPRPVSTPQLVVPTSAIPADMAGSSLKKFLLKLNENYNILKEREAKYGGTAAPLDLLNQIDDYENALELTQQAIELDLPPDDLQAEFSSLNLQISGVVFVTQEPPRKPFTGANPYRGLRKFTEDDAKFFFGRNAAIESLLGTAHYLVETETSRQIPDLIAVLGPSGSGKSSLVRAGLIPALWDGRVEGSHQWPIKVMLPGDHPRESLAQVFAGKVGRELASIRQTLAGGKEALHDLMVETLTIANKPPEAIFVLVIDQFEELFTLCEDEAERRAFIEQILYAAQMRGNRSFVILTMRSDFYSKVAAYKPLAETVTRHQMLVSPLTEKELREAILLPAETVGLELEKALVEKLLADTRDAPGVLPLLQHALLELFHRRDGNLLTLAAYDEIGGVKGALAHRADGVVNDLTSEQQQTVRRIFTRLIRPGEGTVDTRRRAAFAEILTREGEEGEVKDIVQTLADANLLITNYNPETEQEVLDVSHEALIQEWPLLRHWLNQDRRGLRIQQQLSQVTRDWDSLGRDTDSLYRGARLLEVEEWVEANPGEINPLEQTFLAASVELRDHEAAEKEAQRQRELEQQRALAEEQSQRAEEQQEAAANLRQRAVWIAVAGGVAVLLAIAAGWFGFQSNLNAREAATRQIEADLARGTAQAEATRALNAEGMAQAEATKALNAEGTAQAEATKALNAEATARAEAVNALNAEATAQAEATNALNAQKTAEAERVEAKHQASIALSRQLAAQSDSTFDEYKYELALLLAIEAGKVGRAVETDTFEAFKALRQIFIRPGRTRFILNHDATVGKAIWNQDESLVLTASWDGTARVWDAESGTELLILSGHSGSVWQAVWNSDESRILTASLDGTARVWDAENGAELLTLAGHLDGVWQAVWNADESLVLTASWDGTARVWDAESGTELLTLAGHSDRVNYAKWNANENRILTASDDNTARVWDAENGTELLILAGHSNSVLQAVWNTNASRILTTSRDGTARVWDAESGAELLIITDHTNIIWQAVWNADESRILTASFDNTARVWDAENGAKLLTLAGHSDGIVQAVWNADESRILTASLDGTTRVWDAENGTELLILAGHLDDVKQAVWNADESRILTTSKDGTARAWDAEIGTELLTLVGHSDSVVQAVWDTDESRILTASRDGIARVWNAENGAKLLTLAGHSDSVWQAVWNSDESRILTAGADDTARVWDAESGAELLTLAGHSDSVWQAVWNADESRILTASKDGTARVWDAESGTELLTLVGHSDSIEQVVWNVDESRILTASKDGTARVWDAESGTELLTLTLPGRSIPVEQAIWNVDESRILTIHWDNTVRVWDAENGTKLLALSGHTSWIWQAVWNADESRILTASEDNTARVWDAGSSTELFTLSGHSGSVWQAVWNSDESRILTTGADGTARVWDAESGTELFALFGHSGSVWQAVWNSDESRILTAGEDSTVRVFYTQMTDLLTVACEHAPRNMSHQEWRQFMGDTEYRPTCPNLPLGIE